MGALLYRTWRRIRAGRGDDGAQTIEIMLWVGAFIVIVGLVGAIFRDQLIDYFNSLNYSIGL